MSGMEKKSQESRLYDILSDGEPHRSDDLVNLVYGQDSKLARLAARVYRIKIKHHEIDIRSWKAPENAKLHYYQMKRLDFKRDFFVDTATEKE